MRKSKKERNNLEYRAEREELKKNRVMEPKRGVGDNCEGLKGRWREIKNTGIGRQTDGERQK